MNRGAAKGPEALWIQISGKEPTQKVAASTEMYFFPEQENVLGQEQGVATSGFLHQKVYAIWLSAALQQNGEKPDNISGVLVSDGPIDGKSRAIHFSSFSTKDSTVIPAMLENYTSDQVSGGAPGAGTAPATTSNATANSGADANEPVARRSTATTDFAALLPILGAAFVGGLILNLMPCVLPVLSLKVFALIRHAGEHPEKAWRQGVAFTVGVVVSFWVLAGLLLALRAAGNQLGWGFQMQSPGFVAGLIVLFFLLGLNLFGVFEIGGSLVGVDAKAASHAGGGVSSFLNGALATVAATPCTAPFMGSALGFAAQQPAFVSMLIFTFLALGMATPYLLLTCFPQTLRFVPKPGAWMESLKQFMGFLLMGTVIFLVYVFGALTAPDAVPPMLFVLLCFSFLAWVWGRWGSGLLVRFVVLLLAAAVVLWLSCLISAVGSRTGLSQITEARDGWQDWSPEAVQATLAKGQPVFVDFTAAWCLSCKVNERVALGTDAVKKAFVDKNVALFRADWTHSDPVISQELQKFNRDGVPLYLLYSPKAPDAPQVLPEVLTPGIVLEALGKI
jgi:thiol:disulfide interchange protein DsbD